MTFSDISFIFNRALSKTFDKSKLLLMFVVLLLCGMMVVFFRGLSVGAGEWMKKSLTFLPLFLCVGVLLSAGILLIRIYHDEIKEKSINYREVLSKSWEIVLGASYFSVPIILLYLLLWMLMGVFLLFEQVPFVGPFFSIILAFGPFLLNLAAIVLCVVNISMLFFVAPALALKGLSSQEISKSLIAKFNNDIFSNVTLGVIAVLPLALILGVLTLAGIMSGPACLPCKTPLFTTLRWFILMVPFVAFLAPALIFFFNFAAESHVLLLKKVRRKSS
ncbi:MAG: hypothetical protein VX777_06075 [Chlamydiota bacterium]|nr:hypothetical protein [Chlamydiota bacterium]